MVAQDEIFIHHFISSYSLETGELQLNPIWPDRKFKEINLWYLSSNPADETGFPVLWIYYTKFSRSQAKSERFLLFFYFLPTLPTDIY